MSSPILYITYALNGLLMIAMPVVLAVTLARRFKLGWGLWWIGAATFILSQIGHIPFNAGLTLLFERGILPVPPEAWRLPFNAVVLGLSAGLWEELSRYATFRWWARDARSWRKALLVGAGHGGVEAIILGILVLITYFYMVSLRGADLNAVIPADQLDAVRQGVTAYWSAAWPATLLGALERVFTIPIQIAFAVIVLQTFTRRQGFWVWLAVLWHAVVDFAAVFVGRTWGVYAAEIVLGIFSLMSIAMIFALRQPEPPATPEPQAPPPKPDILRPTQIEETTEALENSRFGS
jgi:uncharacterized membrane protein YhfC